MTALTAVVLSAIIIACMAFVTYTVRVWWEKYFMAPDERKRLEAARFMETLRSIDGPIGDSDDGYGLSNAEIEEENKG